MKKDIGLKIIKGTIYVCSVSYTHLDVYKRQVGDRYVLEKMVEHNWTLGGENSGHIIIADKNTTGDGIIASLAVLSAMAVSYTHLLNVVIRQRKNGKKMQATLKSIMKVKHI